MSTTNRAAVLLDLREEEQQLESDLAAVRAAIAGIEILEKRTSTQSQLFGPPVSPTPQSWRICAPQESPASPLLLPTLC
jgi:hypothetical protein